MHLETILMGLNNLTHGIKVDIKLMDRFGNSLNGQEEVYVRVKCLDCMRKSQFDEADIPFLKDSKIKALMKAQEGNCLESDIAGKKLADLYALLDKNEVGYVAVNTYEFGTNIEFMYNPRGYELEKRIKVFTPDVGFSQLEVGKKYYVCDTKNFEDEDIFKPRVLQKIQLRMDNGYDLYFGGLEEPVATLTRGHIEARQKLLNRVDHVVISGRKGSFIGGILRKLGSYYSILGCSEGTKKLLDRVRAEM